MASIILPVPHLLQRQPGECLAACAAMILTYLALPVNYNRLLKLLQVRPDIGAPSFNIRRLKTLGVVEVIYKQGTLVELHDHLMNNRPGIAFVQTGELPYWNKEENNHKKALRVYPNNAAARKATRAQAKCRKAM